MKLCPRCKTPYHDETLNFCLSDGTALISGSDRLSEQTLVRPVHLPRSAEAKKGVNPIFVYLLTGLVALLSVATLVFWLRSERAALPSPNVDNIDRVTPTITPKPGTTPDIAAEREALDREKQKLADERRKLDARKTPAPVNVATPPLTAGNWFIVLGSYPKSQPEQATRRLSYVQSLGHDASIVDTDNYPGLRDGYYSVVLGPYAKDDAKRILTAIKQRIRDAYVKAAV